jgi:hypothetical protein
MLAVAQVVVRNGRDSGLHPLWVSQMSLFPVGVDQVRVVLRMLAPAEPSDAESMERLEKSFEHIHGQVFETEDLSIASALPRGCSPRRESVPRGSRTLPW